MSRRSKEGELFLNKCLFALLTEKGEQWGRTGLRRRPADDHAGGHGL